VNLRDFGLPIVFGADFRTIKNTRLLQACRKRFTVACRMELSSARDEFLTAIELETEWWDILQKDTSSKQLKRATSVQYLCPLSWRDECDKSV